ncbi:MAG: sigma-70 family RNA polymerase sigma factor [Clostridia bacterium]|nr:sigma-70 family RNA polymerase sigma factor [Clostridia bacterium]
MTDIEKRFHALYEAHSRKVLIYITSKCGDVAEIGDIAQEVWCEVWRILNERGVEYIQNPAALCMKLAKHHLWRHYSLREKLRGVPLTVVGEEGDELEITDAALEVMSAEEIVMERMEVQSAASLIAGFDMDTRRIFHLYYSIGLTIPEIAAALGCGQSFVKNKLYRGLKRLREEMTKGDSI